VFSVHGIRYQTEIQKPVYCLYCNYTIPLVCVNRILGMPVDLQNRLFKYFTDTLNAIITQAKKSGRFDMGILGE